MCSMTRLQLPAMTKRRTFKALPTTKAMTKFMTTTKVTTTAIEIIASFQFCNLPLIKQFRKITIYNPDTFGNLTIDSQKYSI